MGKYFLRRSVQLVVVAFIISVLIFLLVHLLPGDPSVIILGPNDNAHNRAVLFKQLGLNKPLFQQYFIWLGAVFHGNLGQSYLNHESVTHIIATGWPIDLELIIISQVIAFAVAIPLALFTSRRPEPARRQRGHHRHLRDAGPAARSSSPRSWWRCSPSGCTGFRPPVTSRSPRTRPPTCTT